MNWKPISESDILDKINSSYKRMNFEQRRIWEIIKIMPEKWKEKTYGKFCDGFWVIAIIGNNIIWYNDIECGFNRSKYFNYGEIDGYWCNQDDLEWTLQSFINEIKDGYDSSSYAGPPQPIG